MYRFNQDMIETYGRFLKEQEKSRMTVEKYMRDIRKFHQFLGSTLSFEREEVLAFKRFLIERYAPASVNSIIAALNGFFRYCSCLDLQMKSIRIQKRVFTDEARELTKSDYMRLLRQAKAEGDERLYHVMLTLGSTGIRVSELAYLTVDAVRRGQVIVHCKNKTRWVLLPGQLKKRLLDFAAKKGITSGCIFVTARGKRLDRSNIWRQMKGMCIKADIRQEKVYPHNFRHLFARTYYQKEKDIVKLGDILGHSNIETTKLYTITTGKEHARQMCRLGLII